MADSDKIYEDDVLRQKLDKPQESRKPLRGKAVKASAGKRSDVKDSHDRYS